MSSSKRGFTDRARAREAALKSVCTRKLRHELTTYSILDAMSSEDLFGKQFGGESWNAWRAFLGALFSLPMGDSLEVFQRHTARTTPTTEAVREAWAIVGRRGGKSRIAALVAVYLSCFRDYSDVLAEGERGLVMVLAPDRRQARVVFGYIKGLLQVPPLRRMVGKTLKESIDLKNGVSIEIHTASFRTTRGYTVLAAICDETAWWYDEKSANPDSEILQALRPAMLTVPGSVLLAITTPYARRGEAYRNYQRYHGQDNAPVLVWQAPTVAMNPLVDEAVIAAAFEQDAIAASAEYLAEFRRDVEAFLSIEAIEGVVIPGRLELPPRKDVKYSAFTDPSGGSQDSFTVAIAHRENDLAVLDAVREVHPPFSPEQVTGEFATLIKSYHLRTVSGDRYAGEWPREQFRKHGVEYKVGDKPKSELYRDLLPLVNSGRVELLDHKVLKRQLEGLERRVARGGKDSIDHGPQGRDDVANSVAGAVLLAARRSQHVDTDGLSFISELRESPWAYDRAPDGTVESFISPADTRGIAERAARYRDS